MFEALLVSIMIGANGHPVEKTWAAFLNQSDCDKIAGSLTISMKESLRRGAIPSMVTFRCDPVATNAKPKK
ncbi:hypothetical protein [Pseudomonas sp. GV047]|uniref:hypothetical protein n=1 Tax=Pseudomonas sp. GV047 TaxID=2135751 RepID=UPI000D3D09FF|nr:hypothetical protein [Pseudomonas sp. GV047]PUB40068.1 hypothetical protein C8K58_11454 [Pseudomonas sp. GV047]